VTGNGMRAHPLAGRANDAVRRGIALALAGAGHRWTRRQREAMRGYADAQAALRRRYAIHADTPILPYGPETARSIAEAARGYGPEARHATTSGSTAKPKRILYPPTRVELTRGVFLRAMAQHLARRPGPRFTFYAFGSLHRDTSLSAMLMAERRAPSYVETLQAPYRLHDGATLRRLAAEHGETAVRLLVIVASNPGLLYATNPSTISTFLDTLVGEWTAARSALAAILARADRERDVARVLRRLASRGSDARLAAVLEARDALPMTVLAPAAHGYVTWTGGYVRPFLDRLAQHLPPSRYHLLPMYSMSTETIETVFVPVGEREAAFVPMGPEVLYEFLPADAADATERLLGPDQLECGMEYTMVVSDAFGLRRYQTDDVFRCVGHVLGLPDLRFVRRRSLGYSFTGEKLTGEQAAAALDGVRAAEPTLGSDAFLTLIPSAPRDGALPHYRLAWVARGDGTKGDVGPGDTSVLERAAARCDALLAAANAEYEAKRTSGRLGSVRAVEIDLAELLRRMGGAGREGWEAQFKFLPLYPRLWEQEAEPADERSRTVPMERSCNVRS